MEERLEVGDAIFQMVNWWASMRTTGCEPSPCPFTRLSEKSKFELEFGVLGPSFCRSIDSNSPSKVRGDEFRDTAWNEEKTD